MARRAAGLLRGYLAVLPGCGRSAGLADFARSGNKAQVQQQIAALEQQLKAAQAKPASTGNAKQMAAKQQELKALQKKVNQLQFSLGYE